MPDRHGPLRIGLPRFIESVNGGRISNGARVLSGNDAGIGNVELDFFEESPTVPTTELSLVFPEGARNGETTSPRSMLAMIPGGAVPGDSLFPGSTWWPGSTWVPAKSWFPGSKWWPGSTWAPGRSWWPGSTWEPQNPTELNVLCLAEEGQFSEIFGVSPEALGGSSVPKDEEIPAESTIIAIPGKTWSPANGWGPESGWNPSTLFDAGLPAPLGGVSFGMGVLSTPDASIAGQSANPLVGMDTEELLHREETRELLKKAGLTDADTVRWLTEPTKYSPETDQRTTLLGSETTIESYRGIVNGNDGPWGVGVHIARVTRSDHVIAAGAHRQPLGTNTTDFIESDQSTRLERGRTLMSRTTRNLEQA